MKSIDEAGKMQSGEEDPCWKGYKMVGMKKGKNGEDVPNCVPIEDLDEDNTNDESDDGEGMDKVQPKALKKKFVNRKDKDIDNDGDEDDSDEYLHKRRKAVSKALSKER